MSRSRPTTKPSGRPAAPLRPAGLIALVVALLMVASAATALAAEPTGSASSSSPSPSPSVSTGVTRGTGLARTVTIGTDPAVVASTPAPTPSPTPAPTAAPTITPLSGSITFHGRGWGHGVGMSQHGARGRALAGQTATEIVAHYYQGSTMGTMDPETPIRVLLLNTWTASASVPLTIYGRWADWTIDGVDAVFPPEAKLIVQPTVSGSAVNWRAVVTSAEGVVLHDAPVVARLSIRSAGPGALKLWSKPSVYDTYRGNLTVLLASASPTLHVVNALPIDEYLRGVVPVEMSSSYPTEALKAQALASRSYAAYRLRPGVGNYDVTDNTSSQVYRGVLGEKAITDALLAAAPGAVLYSGSAYVNALFHSTGGGATEHNENAFVSSTGARLAVPVSYLRGSSDRAPDGTAWDAAAPYATWQTGTYSVTLLSQWFAADSRTNVGTLQSLDLRSRGVSGRLYKVTLIGSTGTKTVSGNVFREVFNVRRPSTDPMLRSTLFDLSPIP